MFLNRAVGVGSLALVSLALLLLPARSAVAQPGVNAAADVLPRRVLPKTPSAQLTVPTRATGEILVKFNDNVRARMQAGVLNAQGAVNVAPARAIMAQFQLTAEPLFSFWTNERLGRLEAKATAASGKAQPDLAGMIAFKAPWANLQAAARALNDLDSVEWVSFRQDWRPMAGVAERCCLPTGECVLLPAGDCIAAGGTPGGAGSDCTFACGPGACCTMGNCTVEFNEEDCVLLGGIYLGFDLQVVCDTDTCDIACGDSPDSCFEAPHDQACSDEDCCDLVCSFKPDCCEMIWDLQCASLANLHCITPGPPDGPDRCASPDNGDCFEVHFTAGCVDETCCNIVCTTDPFCCGVFGFWDAVCVAQAQSVCGAPPAVGPTPLLTARQGYLRENSYRQQAGGPLPGTAYSQGGAGWNLRGDNYALWVINEINIDVAAGSGDANADGSVDDGDQFVEIVNNFDIDMVIGGWAIRTFDSFIGDCGAPTGGTGCSDPDCQDIICDADPFCCSMDWDQICADAALTPGSIGCSPPVVVHEFPMGTVVRDTEAIVVFAVAPADPNDPIYGGATLQEATVMGAPTGVLQFYAPSDPDTGSVELVNANGAIMASYTWADEASQMAALTRIPDVVGPDAIGIFLDVPGLRVGDSQFTPGTRSDGSVFTTTYEGLYGVSRELIEVFGIGETIPPGTNNFDDLRYNARGRGINVAVIEWSFYQGHEDLNVIIEPGQTLVPVAENVPEHATACLGIINGQENDIGVTGIAPEAQAYFFPLFSLEELARNEAAFLSAYELLNAGDVVSCSFGPGDPAWNLNNEMTVWTLMRLGSDLGITTCLAAGNDCENLSQAPDLGDSGAVVVGAGDPGALWCRRSFSNYYQDGDFNDDSNVVHCQAWGVGVQTCGYPAPGTDPDRSYYAFFNGTSASAPQIAGLAACLQGLAKQVYGIHLGPSAIRGALATGFLQCGFPDPDDLPGFPDPPGSGCLPDTDPDSGPNKIGIYPRPGRGDVSSANSVLNFSGFGQSPLIDELTIVTGELIQGNVFSIKGPDDNYLIIESRHANPNSAGDGGGGSGGIVTGQTTMFQLIGHMQNPNIESMEIDVEAFVDNGTGIQLIYMFDWDLNRWLAVAAQFLGTVDTDTFTIFEIENGSRFIRNSDNRIMLRLQTVALGVSGLHRSFTDWVNIRRVLGDAFLSNDPGG